MLYFLSKKFLEYLKRRWYEVGIVGLENIPKTGGFILAANHNDPSDPPFIIAALKRRVYFLAEKNSFERAKKWSKMLKPFLDYTGQLTIVKNKGESSMVLQKAKMLLQKGKLFCIFPEGTTRGGEKILEGKTGVARLALMSKKPVIPIAIKGTFGIVPPDYKYAPKKYRSIEIRIGKPMIFREFYGKENNKRINKRIVKNIMKQIKILYKVPK